MRIEELVEKNALATNALLAIIFAKLIRANVATREELKENISQVAVNRDIDSGVAELLKNFAHHL